MAMGSFRQKKMASKQTGKIDFGISAVIDLDTQRHPDFLSGSTKYSAQTLAQSLGPVKNLQSFLFGTDGKSSDMLSGTSDRF